MSRCGDVRSPLSESEIWMTVRMTRSRRHVDTLAATFGWLQSSSAARRSQPRLRLRLCQEPNDATERRSSPRSRQHRTASRYRVSRAGRPRPAPAVGCRDRAPDRAKCARGWQHRDSYHRPELTLPASAKLPPGVTISFEWVRVRGKRAFVSGHGPLTPDGAPAGPFGKVPSEVPLEVAQESARLTALAVLASLKEAISDLDRIVAWGAVNGFVNADPGYEQTTLVLNPFSDLILELFGPDIGPRPYRDRRRDRSAQPATRRVGGSRVVLAAGGPICRSAPRPTALDPGGRATVGRARTAAPNDAHAPTSPGADRHVVAAALAPRAGRPGRRDSLRAAGFTDDEVSGHRRDRQRSRSVERARRRLHIRPKPEFSTSAATPAAKRDGGARHPCPVPMWGDEQGRAADRTAVPGRRWP
jgi:enamine deaminase RidA (YjgF/YER057c/UK114 family)